MKKKTEFAALPRAGATGRPPQENTNVLVFGKKGFGKSTWVQNVLTKNRQRLIVIDTLLRDYDDGEIITDIAALMSKLSTRSESGEFRYICRIPRQELRVVELFRFRQDIKRALIRNTTLVVEEITSFCDSSYIPPALLDHLQYGRHSGNALVGVSRSPFEINPHLRRQADLIVSFRQDEDRDIEFFRRMNKNADQLRTLEKYQPVLIRGTMEELETFTNPR